MSNKTIEPEQFAMAASALYREWNRRLSDQMPKVVRAACREARDEARREVAGQLKPMLTPRYAEGLTYHVDKHSDLVTGRVGNQLYPGLVHLLEKGHARVGGGRVEARPHMRGGYEAGAKVLVERAEQAVRGT